MSFFTGKNLVTGVVHGGVNRAVLLEGLNSFQLDKLPYVDFFKKDQLPETAGIYFVVDKNGKVWYIGKAKNLKDRWVRHHRYDQIEKINKKSNIKLLWYSCENNENNLTQLENYFIDAYHPALNQTKVEAKSFTPAEIELRNTLSKIAKYVVIFGHEENSKEFGMPAVYLKYDCLYRNPARMLRSIFDAVNRRGSLRWSYYWRVKSNPIWKAKCNGINIIVGGYTNVNEFIKRGEATTLAGISLLNMSDDDFHKYVLEEDWSQSYHPAIGRYTKDPIPLLWSKNLEINQHNAEKLKELSERRTESKIGKCRSRGTKVRVVCTKIGWGAEHSIETYKEAIEWFGGYELLGLKQIYSRHYSSLNGFKPHRVTVRIPEGKTYRSLSAPISASTQEELMQRFEKIRQLSPLHQRVKLER